MGVGWAIKAQNRRRCNRGSNTTNKKIQKGVWRVGASRDSCPPVYDELLSKEIPRGVSNLKHFTFTVYVDL